MDNLDKSSEEMMAEIMPRFEEAVFAYFAEELSPIDKKRVKLSHSNGYRPTKDEADMFHAMIALLLMQALDDAAGYVAKNRGCKWEGRGIQWG